MARNPRTTSGEKSERKLGVPVICACLWMVAVLSSLGVVYSTFETRQATQQLEELRREAGSLQVESGMYLLEKSSLAAYTRVESEAEKKLGMEMPAIEDLQMVRR